MLYFGTNIFTTDNNNLSLIKLQTIFFVKMNYFVCEYKAFYFWKNVFF